MKQAPYSHADYKRRAKQQLQDGWAMAAVATLVVYAIMSLCSFTGLLYLVAAGPLCVGYILYLIYQADAHQSDFNLLFKGFTGNLANTLVSGILVSVIVGVGFALLIVPGIILACGLSMTFFIQAEDASISGTDAMRMSWEMMKGYKMDYFLMMLEGFFLWFLLGILLCGIPMLWITPYAYMSTLNYYRMIKYGKF